MVVNYPRTVWKNSYAEHEVTGKTYNLKKKEKDLWPGSPLCRKNGKWPHTKNKIKSHKEFVNVAKTQEILFALVVKYLSLRYRILRYLQRNFRISK